MTNKSVSTLASNIKTGIENALKEIHTSMPGIIESFDSSKQIATVRPAIKRVFKAVDNEKEILIPTELPMLINVPVIFPRSGDFYITFPVNKGDECLIVFSERSIDNWLLNGIVSEPKEKRFFSLSDAIVILGLYSTPNKISNFDNTNMKIMRNDASVELTLYTDGNIKVKADTKLLIETPLSEFSNDVLIKGELEVQGSTTLSADVTSNGKDISDTHTHSGSPTAPTGSISNTGVPV